MVLNQFSKDACFSVMISAHICIWTMLDISPERYIFLVQCNAFGKLNVNKNEPEVCINKLFSSKIVFVINELLHTRIGSIMVHSTLIIITSKHFM